MLPIQDKKTLSNLRIEKLSKLFKDIYKKFTTNIIFNDEKLNAVLPRIERNNEADWGNNVCSNHSYSTEYWNFSHWNKVRLRNKKHKDWGAGNKLVCAYNMFLYVENLKEY